MSSRARLSSLTFAIAMTLLACDPGADVEPPGCMEHAEATPTIFLSSATGGAEAFVDGAKLKTVLGPQGLHMAWFTVDLQDFVHGRVPGERRKLELKVLTDGLLVGALRESRKPTLVGDDSVRYERIRIDVSKADNSPCLDGRLMRLQVATQDGCGRPIKAVRELVMHFPLHPNMNFTRADCEQKFRGLASSPSP